MKPVLHFASVLALFVTAACAATSAPAAASNPSGTRTVDPATAGSIDGRVLFAGRRPAVTHIAMGPDPVCMEALGANPTSEAVLIANDGAVQNVFVYLKDGLDHSYRFSVPTTPLVLDQKGCRYAPRVAGVLVGQPVEITNSDPTFHNVHGLPSSGQEFNTGQPMQGMRERRVFNAPDVMIEFKCDVHGWMRGYLGVVDSPYFAVTGPDGRFALTNVPPGTYTIEAWHEKFGRRTARVTVGRRQTQTVAFSFSASAD
jgi:hypothetical protein